MLQIVKEFIQNLPDESFQTFYTHYIMQVQDSNIEEEFRFLIAHNNLDVLSVDKLISNDLGKLVK